MKQIISLFLAMLISFTGTWAYKLNKPLSPFDAYAYGYDAEADAWWNDGISSEDKITADADWRLDPEIPDNYIPVLGADELYMVVGSDGKILGYRHRIRQEDGSWLWEDVDPNIPENYELVEGFTDLYRVIGADGSVRYFRYTRNDDDTYFFTECDEKGNPLKKNPSGDEIPGNYVRVTGNIYAVYNEHGVVIGYKERVLNPDGTYTWVDVAKPDIPVKKPGTSNSGTNGSNGDNGEDGKQQVIKLEIPGLENNGTGGDINIIIDPGSTVKSEPKEGGGYTETESYTDSETKGGYTTIYETTVTKTYDKSGKLVSTKKVGPIEISKYPAVGSGDTKLPNPARIESTIDAEYVRVTNGLSFDSAVANEVLAGLNAERASQNLSPLAMSSGSLYKAAAIKAADMAIYNHSDFDSPMYGTIDSLLVRFGVTVNSPSETLWKTTSKTGSQINERFMAQSASYESRMSEYYSEVAIAIVKQDGYMYIAEIFN